MHPFIALAVYQQVPGQLVIQMTDRCNAHCPQCGMRVTEPFPRSTLSMDDIKRILDAALLRKVQAVSFTGGEPLLHVDALCELITYAGKLGIPYIRTGTNGFMFSRPERSDFKYRIEKLADKLALTPIRNFWISIDSYIDTVHEKMRGFKNIIKGIETAMPIFHRYGLYPSANIGINRNIGGNATRLLRNRHKDMTEEAYLSAFHTEYKQAFNVFFQFIIDIGFTIVNTCYPMSVSNEEKTSGLEAVYAATTTSDIVRFGPGEKAVLFKSLLQAVNAYRKKIRIFSPTCSLHMLCSYYQRRKPEPYPCRGGLDFFFVDAKDANTYPCGYRGNDSYGKFWEMGKQRYYLETPCTRCDWECFRDPSELFGPLVEMLSHPFRLLKRIHSDVPFYKYWLNDLRYYRCCDYFNGRMAPDYRRLTDFRPVFMGSNCRNDSFSP